MNDKDRRLINALIREAIKRRINEESAEDEVERNQTKMKSELDSIFSDEFRKWVLSDKRSRMPALMSAYDILLNKTMYKTKNVDPSMSQFLNIASDKKAVPAGNAFLETKHGIAMTKLVGKYFVPFKTSFESETDAIRTIFLPIKRTISKLNTEKEISQTAKSNVVSDKTQKSQTSDQTQSTVAKDDKYVGGQKKFNSIVRYLA